jgi:hypothetical protein
LKSLIEGELKKARLDRLKEEKRERYLLKMQMLEQERKQIEIASRQAKLVSISRPSGVSSRIMSRNGSSSALIN